MISRDLRIFRRPRLVDGAHMSTEGRRCDKFLNTAGLRTRGSDGRDLEDQIRDSEDFPKIANSVDCLLNSL